MEDSTPTHSNISSNVRCKSVCNFSFTFAGVLTHRKEARGEHNVSQKSPSLPWIIRNPTKRSRLGDSNVNLSDRSIYSDDNALNLATDFRRHPYGSLGAKPYMSQPLLDNGLGHGSIGNDDSERNHSLEFAGSMSGTTTGPQTSSTPRPNPHIHRSTEPKPLEPPITSILSVQSTTTQHAKSVSGSTQAGLAFLGAKKDVAVGSNVDIVDETRRDADDKRRRPSLERENSAHSCMGAERHPKSGKYSQQRFPSASASAAMSESTHLNHVKWVDGELSNSHAVLLERKPSSLSKPLPALPGEIPTAAVSARSIGATSMDVGSDTLSVICNGSAPTSTADLAANMSASVTAIQTVYNTTSTTTTPTIIPIVKVTTPTSNDASNAPITRNLQNEISLSTPFSPKRSVSTGAPVLTQKPHRLSLSALNRRLSLGMLEGSARLSPSIIIRPPPLPLINLPVLTSPASTLTTAILEVDEDRDGRKERRQSRIGLMSIPALPLQGPSRGTRGHEEVDDLEEDDEEEDENENEDGDEDDREINTGEATGRSVDNERSMYNDESDNVASKLLVSIPSRSSSTTSSYVTARAEPSPLISDPYLGNGTSQPPEVAWSTGELCQVSNVDKGKARQIDEEVNYCALPGNPGLTLDSGDYGHGNSRGFSDLTRVGCSKAVNVNRGETVVGRGASSTGLYVSSSNRSIPGISGAEGRDCFCNRTHLPSPYFETRMVGGVPRASGEESAVSTPRPSQPNSETVSITTTASFSSAFTPAPPAKASRPSVNTRITITQHPGMFKRASQSLVDVHAIQTKEMMEKLVRDHEREEERKRAVRKSMRETPDRGERKGQEGKDHDQASQLQKYTSNTREEDTSNTTTSSDPLHPLRRRRSMPTTSPPHYSSLPLYSFGGLPNPKIQPREDEGKERLPPYTNDIYLEAIMPRKMEFSSPGVQAKDRKWRRVLCVLEGTVFKIYKCTASAAGVSSIGGWWERKVGVRDLSADSGNVTSTVVPPHDVDVQEGNSSMSSWDVEVARGKNGADKSGNGADQPALDSRSPTKRPQRQPPPPQCRHTGHRYNRSLGVIPTTKSALTFAVQLLKPQTRHTRSNSDVALRSPRGQSPRSSLNIPRSPSGRSTPTTSNHGSISMRSHSPTASSSTRISTPPSSAAVSQPSRPSTPALTVNDTRAEDSQRRLGALSKDKKNNVDMTHPIRVYTMQRAESGLGKDYTKRQHVVRVRLEGEQFLIQTKGVDDVITWVEVRTCGAGRWMLTMKNCPGTSSCCEYSFGLGRKANASGTAVSQVCSRFNVKLSIIQAPFLEGGGGDVLLIPRPRLSFLP